MTSFVTICLCIYTYVVHVVSVIVVSLVRISCILFILLPLTITTYLPEMMKVRLDVIRYSL